MEEKKVKLSTVIIILLLLVIIAGIVYIYGIKSNETNTSNIENNNNLVKEEIQSKPAGSENKNTENVELSDQEKFDSYINSYKNDMKKILNEKKSDEGNNEDSLFKDEIYAYSTNTYSDITDAWIELDKNGNVSFIMNKTSELYSKYGSKYKIAENIASIYMCEIGQGGMFDLVMLGFDGSAKSLFMSKDDLLKGINVKNIDVKYAVNVVPYNNVAATYGIVDINGNIITNK